MKKTKVFELDEEGEATHVASFSSAHDAQEWALNKYQRYGLPFRVETPEEEAAEEPAEEPAPKAKAKK